MTQKFNLIVYPEIHKTKVAVYRNIEPVFMKNITHSEEDLAQFKKVLDQKEYRMQLIKEELEKNNFPLNSMELIMGRSGMVKPVSEGVYHINKTMIHDLESNIIGMHVTNLGGLMAYELAREIGKNAYIANPVVLDELIDEARFTGHPKFENKSVFHALNHKFVAFKYSKAVNRPYNELNLIVCHIGRGGVSVGAHEKGRVVDVNQAFDGGGPFGITRTGTLPMGQLVEMCFSGEFIKEEIIEMITENGGYKAYLGTSNINEINQMIAEGDEMARKVSHALSYQVSKEIASHVATLKGKVDAIILTGVIFDSSRFLENVKLRIGSIAPIALYPSVNDVEALAMYGYKIAKGEIEVKEYI
ncbi:MAG: butyrate kinase [bacterium]|jgi:butyrate kinase